MSRFVPTLQQLEEARQKLPSAYHYDRRSRGPVHRIAVCLPLSDFHVRDNLYAVEAAVIPVIDFRLDWRKDPDGFEWRRWVYEGPVAV